MWTEIVKEMADFSSAVLTSVDASGYPFSIRCKPSPEPVAQVLRVQIPENIQFQPGPAGLLCHKHNESLWNLKSFTLSGLLEQDAQGWLFRPLKYIPGAGIGGLPAMVKFVREGRHSAKQYLEKRHLPHPVIEWNTVHEIWAEIHSKGQ